MFPHEVRLLFSKEWRQLLRSKAALATSLLLPLFLMVALPGLLIVSLSSAAAGKAPPKDAIPAFLPGLAELGPDPTHGLPRFMLPMVIGIVGLALPSVAGSFTLLQERESRTIELLVALPVRIGQVLLAKLLAILLLSLLVTFPLLALDAIGLVAYGFATPGFALALFVELAGALSWSTAMALLVSLIARDYRASQNVMGALLGPSIAVMGLAMLLVPGGALKVAGIGLVFATAAAIGSYVAIRIVTFERLLR